MPESPVGGGLGFMFHQFGMEGVHFFLEKKSIIDVHMDNDTCINEEENTINPFLSHK